MAPVIATATGGLVLVGGGLGRRGLIRGGGIDFVPHVHSLALDRLFRLLLLAGQRRRRRRVGEDVLRQVEVRRPLDRRLVLRTAFRVDALQRQRQTATLR